MASRVSIPRLLWITGYVAVIGILATVSRIVENPVPYLIAAALTLPVSIVAVPCLYYVAGILSQIPEANPSYSGTECFSDNPDMCVSWGEPAVWYLTAIDVVAVVLLVGTALMNVVLFSRVLLPRLGSRFRIRQVREERCEWAHLERNAY